MEEQTLKIKKIEDVTHNVLRFKLEKSSEIKFQPGQAAEIAIDKDGWRDEAHPFTFTSIPSDDDLEFTIKIYPEHEGLTNELSKLSEGDHLILKSVFGTIQYQGTGTFIAGGAGVTPFISIIRNLDRQAKLAGNRLIFANKTSKDIINQEEFETVFEGDFFNILSKEDVDNYAYGLVDASYLKDKIASMEGYFYICGPTGMMKSVEESLKELGVRENQIVKEEF